MLSSYFAVCWAATQYPHVVKLASTSFKDVCVPSLVPALLKTLLPVVTLPLIRLQSKQNSVTSWLTSLTAK